MARNSNAGVGIYVDTKAFNRMASDLRRVAPEVYKTAQVSLRAVARNTLAKAAAKASYSKRIPGSGKVRMRGLNAKIQFGGDAAPNAAPIENKGKGFVRHPVFIPKDQLPGPPGRWTEKNSHPAFLGPSFEEDRDEAMAIIDEAVFRTIERTVGL